MMSPVRLFQLSAKELKKPSALCGAGMLLALSVALDFAGSIVISPELEIQFTFLAAGICAMLYGPAVGIMHGIAGDLICHFLRPSGPFFPGFTLNAVISAIICGLILYRQDAALWRAVLTRLLVIVCVNLLLNPLWLSILYGKGYMVYLSARIVKNLILFPIESILLYLVMRVVRRIKPIDK